MDKRQAIQYYGTIKGVKNVMKEEINIISLKDLDIRNVKAETLADINQIEIDTSLKKEVRLEKYIKEIGNPYCFKSNGIVVKVSYNENAGTLQEKMKHLLESIIL